jgi:mycothiol synthase
MQAGEHRDVVADVDDVEARVLRGDDGIDAAVALLDRAEAAAGAPLVDEAERARLEDLAEGAADRADHWHSVVARRQDQAIGYAGLVMPPETERRGVAHGDVAVDRDHTPCEPPLQALLAAVDELGRRHDVGRLQVWLRHATEPDLHCAARSGYAVDRRLGVLGRALDDLPPVDVPEGVTISGFTDADADDVVEVLAAAYADTPDGGWTRAAFDGKRDYDWFHPDDLLVARGPDGHVRGVHWTKRRGPRTGEVYNLAVHPDAQGGRLGAALLHAGLEHLRDTGCDHVLLWVDLANERAVRLYASQGFEVVWEDVALGRHLT